MWNCNLKQYTKVFLTNNNMSSIFTLLFDILLCVLSQQKLSFCWRKKRVLLSSSRQEKFFMGLTRWFRLKNLRNLSKKGSALWKWTPYASRKRKLNSIIVSLSVGISCVMISWRANHWLKNKIFPLLQVLISLANIYKL